MNNFAQFVNEKKSKIACLECDEVNTKRAWQKNNGFCPSCKASSQGVAESTITEGKKVTLKRKYTDNYPAITVGKNAFIRNKMLELIGHEQISYEKFENILNRLSSNKKRWLKNNAKFFNITEKGVNLTKFGHKALASITLNEEPKSNKKIQKNNKPLEMRINEEVGLMIKGRTRDDNQKIDDILDELGLTAEWDHKEGFFFLEEEEDLLDELEAMIQKEFDKEDVNAHFEGVFENQINEALRTNMMAAFQDIERYNRNGFDFNELIESLVLNLGFKINPLNVHKAAEHIGASENEDETIPEDMDVVKELFQILQELNESFIHEKTTKNPEIWVPDSFDKAITRIPNSQITYDIVEKLAVKHDVAIDNAIQYVEFGWDLNLTEKNHTNEANDFTGPGLKIMPKTKKDSDLVDQVMEELGLESSFNVEDGCYFVPDKEGQYAQDVENKIEKALEDKGGNATYAVQEDINQELTQNNSVVFESFSNFIKSINERVRGHNNPEAIRQDRKDLKKTSIKNLKDEWNRIYKIGDLSDATKEDIIVDILVARYGKKRFKAAFENLNSINESKLNKSDIEYQLSLDISGNTKPKVKRLTKKEIEIRFGYKVEPDDVIDSIKSTNADIELKHVEWKRALSNGGTHTFKII